jgi:hypothetical protein
MIRGATGSAVGNECETDATPPLGVDVTVAGKRSGAHAAGPKNMRLPIPPRSLSSISAG